MKLRNVQKEDLSKIRMLNEAAVPHVNSIPLSDFEHFMEFSSFFLVAEGETGEVVGFLIVIPPGQSYDSLNYQYFSQRFSQFDYVDRIVVAETYRGKGIGTQFYDHIAERSLQKRITCEVNVKPPNPQSLAFHARMGFIEIAQQDTEGGKKRVSLLVRELEN